MKGKPFLTFIVVIIIGYLAKEFGRLDDFIVVTLAYILANHLAFEHILNRDN